MEVKQSTKGPAPLILGILGGIAGSFIFGPGGGIVVGLSLYAAGKKRIVDDMNEIDAKDSYKIAGTWQKNKLPGEKGLKVSQTMDSGTLLNLPVTRECRFTDD